MNNIIIIGGGTSILDGLQEIDLQNVLKGQLVIGCNSAFADFEVTATCYLDELFSQKYRTELSEQILITKKSSNPERYFKNYFTFDSYSSHLGLTGIFALSLFNSLFKNSNIFLLGFDFINGTFHDRNKVSNRDIYNLPQEKIKEIFDKIEISNNIYNVNLNSNIENYVKISYQTFLSFLKNQKNDFKKELLVLLYNNVTHIS